MRYGVQLWLSAHTAVGHHYACIVNDLVNSNARSGVVKSQTRLIMLIPANTSVAPSWNRHFKAIRPWLNLQERIEARAVTTWTLYEYVGFLFEHLPVIINDDLVHGTIVVPIEKPKKTK